MKRIFTNIEQYLTGREQFLTEFPPLKSFGNVCSASRLFLPKPRNAFSPLITITAVRVPAIIRKSPSTGWCRRSPRGRSGFCLPWLPAPERPLWPFKSAGNSGVPAGTGSLNIDVPRSFIWPTGIFWLTIPRTRSSPPLVMLAGRLRTARPTKASRFISPSIRR